MSKRLLEKCPHCNHDLGVALNRYLFQSLPGSNFEFECPNCKITVEVEVESQPIFWVSKISRPTQDAADFRKTRGALQIEGLDAVEEIRKLRGG